MASPTTLDPCWKHRPLLVFACHEAWVYQMRLLHRPLDIVVGLRGRPAGWDHHMRPVPPQARLIHLEEALRSAEPYGCIIAHNLSDLLDAKNIPGPRLLVLHETLDGAALEQQLPVPVDRFREAVAKFLALTATHVVAVSRLKGRSWGWEDDLVPFSADVADYGPWRGETARGLRVANHILRRPRSLRWEFHRQAFGELPVTLVGHNPGMEGVQPAAGWDHLKGIFSQHRFYIHTADPRLEDGYNMATLEAMAAGLPVLGNCHPTSAVEHGVSGFVSDDPAELRSYALRLLGDRALAQRMGAAAREAVARHFSGARFQSDFSCSIERAQRQWLASPQGAPHCFSAAPC
jgi:glycosyltransferase involved in cell wall biosynthesis